MRKIYEGEAYKFYRQSDKVPLTHGGIFRAWTQKASQVILNNALDNEKGTTDIQSALMYFDSITKYMQQLRTALEELRDDIE